jgi:hypothetical protein
MALYIEFLVGKPGGYSKGIFKFRMEPYATNVPLGNLMFRVG